MTLKKVLISIIVLITIVLLGILDYHVLCMYLKYLKIPYNLTLSIRSLGIGVDLTILLLFIQVGIVVYVVHYEKTKTTLIYPKNNV